MLIHEDVNRLEIDNPTLNPFLKKEFYQLLERSQVVGGNSGWHPVYFDKKFASYIKMHSYGEYIFDWAWANAYAQFGLSYYPKLVFTTPFTPVNANRHSGPEILQQLDQTIHSKLSSQMSSTHFLFNSESEAAHLKELGYFTQKTIQFHWQKVGGSMDDYYAKLKSKKRKNIKKERNKASTYDLEIKRLTSLDAQSMQQVYELYLSTIDKKYSQAYLNQRFFQLLSSLMSEDFFVFAAFKNDTMVAMSLFFQSESTLYGRYWGIAPMYANDYPMLHFEMCYYLAMEYCYENNLSLFEAGAQGEQKLLRGFEPVTIYSSHKLYHPQMHQMIKHHIEQYNHSHQQQLADLRQYMPYKEIPQS